MLSTPFKSKSDRLRVPLSVMIDYKGFRAMAIGFVAIDTQDQLKLGYRPGRNGTYFMAKKIDDMIQ